MKERDENFEYIYFVIKLKLVPFERETSIFCLVEAHINLVFN